MAEGPEDYLERAKAEGRITPDGSLIADDGMYLSLAEAAARSGLPITKIRKWAQDSLVKADKTYHNGRVKWLVLDRDIE
jgi:hypothetical protein